MDEELEETCIECLDLLYSRRFCDDELWIVYKTMMTLMHKLNPQCWANPSADLGFSDPWINGSRSGEVFKENSERGNIKLPNKSKPMPPPPPPPKKVSPK